MANCVAPTMVVETVAHLPFAGNGKHPTIEPAEAARLREMVADNESWLTDRIIDLAKTLGFTPYTSTLRQAWQASVCGLSEPIVTVLEDASVLSTIPAVKADSIDFSVAYGIAAAQRHRARGVSLGMFIGLMKGYREVYLELGAQSDLAPDTLARYRQLIKGFFDRVEIGVCSEWYSAQESANQELQGSENKRLVNEKNKYLTIFESLRDPVFLVDRHGLVENMNFAAATLFSPDAIPGGRYYGSGPHLPLAELTGFDFSLELRPDAEHELSTRAGARWFSIKTQSMLDVSEKFLGTVVILHDVTELRQAKENAEALARAKADFIATMSHEIRTPIHSIGGIAELLQQSPLSDRDRSYVDAISHSSDLLAWMMSNILDYSRIEAGAMETAHVPFTIASILEDVTRLVTPLVRRKRGLRLIVEAPDLPIVMGDPGRIRQILINLASNAVKFTDQGVVRILVEKTGEREARCKLRLAVRDTGPGITEEERYGIFKPFTQSKRAALHRDGGVGLGLAICLRLADQIGGRLGVSSHPGQGSNFWLDLELATVAGEVAGAHSAGAPVRPPARALCLLVVEDDDSNALVASSLLGAVGHRTVVARNGEEALAAVAEEDFDLIFTDLNLPDIDGLELARTIKGLANRKKSGIPIVAISAAGLTTNASALSDAGICEFLAKPFRFAHVEAVLWRIAGASSPNPIRMEGTGTRSTRRSGDGSPDIGVLRDHIAALGAESAAQIVDTFKKSAGKTVTELEEAAAGERWQQVSAIAHRLKSSARHVGLDGLSERAAKVEDAFRDGAGARAVLDALVVECRRAPHLLDEAWTLALAD